jgi:hypothetical protein
MYNSLPTEIQCLLKEDVLEQVDNLGALGPQIIVMWARQKQEGCPSHGTLHKRSLPDYEDSHGHPP